MTLDELRKRATQLGAKAAAAGACDSDNPYVDVSEGLADLWAAGYFRYLGAVRVVRREAKRVREAA